MPYQVDGPEKQLEGKADLGIIAYLVGAVVAKTRKKDSSIPRMNQAIPSERQEFLRAFQKVCRRSPPSVRDVSSLGVKSRILLPFGRRPLPLLVPAAAVG